MYFLFSSCPECRQTSDYICPSWYWVETAEEKEKLLSEYKDALNAKECKYFRRGEGECPFGNKCFYRHTNEDGQVVDVGPPPKRSLRANADGELSLVERLLFFDFLRERNNLDDSDMLPLELLDLIDVLSDSDSEFDFLLS